MSEATFTPPDQADTEDHRVGVRTALAARIRAIMAGLSPAELRAIVRGEAPTERPNPRYLAHTSSFLLHIRPRTYPAATTWFSHTFHLGLLAVFLFILETVTGLILMLYYVPTPDGAYASILRLSNAVPFGSLLRDVHRLAAEAMVAVVFLHMLRTYFTGSYKGPRTFTWLTGVLLLLLTLLLAFSGYLLPWDQLAYWAVTIGTSMVSAAPVVGRELNLLLRGAADIGADGLLRFYLLHVVLLPLATVVLLSVHYYKVARSHGISLPARVEEGNMPAAARSQAMRRVNFVPDILGYEAMLATVAMLALLAAVAFAYDAPLESHANPLRTPLATQAPWFFLWVQGLLKLGDKSLMGVLAPTAALAALLALPYLDRNPARLARRRPLAILAGVAACIGLLALSYIGLPTYGIELPPATQILQRLAPEEDVGPLRAVSYQDLAPGIYLAEEADAAALSPALARIMTQFAQDLAQARATGALPRAEGTMTVEERQAGLKAVRLHIRWQPEGEDTWHSAERMVYIHRDRDGRAEAPAEPGTADETGSP